MGILQRETYAEVAKNNKYSDKHVKKVSHELLRMLSNLFGEPVKKNNLESVLERQITVNVSLGKKNSTTITIDNNNNCLNLYLPPEQSQLATTDGTDDEQQDGNNINIEATIDKLRGFGLSDEQIAEALDLPLELFAANS